MSEQNQVQAFTGYSDPISFYLTDDRPGVLVSWEGTERIGIAQYAVQVSDYMDGNFTTLVVINAPGDKYLDTTGHPSFWYRFLELDSSGAVIVTRNPIKGEELLINMSLYNEVQRFMEVAIFDEAPFEWNRNRTMCRMAFKNWNTSPVPQIRISGPSNDGMNDPFIVLDEYEPTYQTIDGDTQNYPNGLVYKLDYNGRIWFKDVNGNPVSVQSYDTIHVDYTVQLVTSTDLNQALYMALQTINAQPGTNKHSTPASVPILWDAAMITGATYYLLRKLLTGMSQREFRLLLQDPDQNAFDAVGLLQKTIEIYQKQWEDDLKKLPIAQYPRLFSVVTPEYIMPGGRSRFFRYVWKGMA